MNTQLIWLAFTRQRGVDQDIVLEAIKTTCSNIHTLTTSFLLAIIGLVLAVYFRRDEVELLGLKIKPDSIFHFALLTCLGVQIGLAYSYSTLQGLLKLTTFEGVELKALTYIFTDTSPFNRFAVTSPSGGTSWTLSYRHVTSLLLYLISIIAIFVGLLQLNATGEKRQNLHKWASILLFAVVMLNIASIQGVEQTIKQKLAAHFEYSTLNKIYISGESAKSNVYNVCYSVFIGLGVFGFLCLRSYNGKLKQLLKEKEFKEMTEKSELGKQSQPSEGSQAS